LINELHFTPASFACRIKFTVAIERIAKAVKLKDITILLFIYILFLGKF